MTSDLEALLARATELEQKANAMVLEATGAIPAAPAAPDGVVEALEAKLDALEDHMEVLAAADPTAGATAGTVPPPVPDPEPAPGGVDPDFEDEVVEMTPEEKALCLHTDVYGTGPHATCMDCGSEVAEAKGYDFDDLADDDLVDGGAGAEVKVDPELETKGLSDDELADIETMAERRKALDAAL